MSKASIFFSYAREDGEFALRLATNLRKSGADIWMDQLDIRAGTRWDDEVEKALQSSRVLLVILSPASSASRNVSDEIAYALDEGKEVIPVLFRECSIPFRIRRIQYADFTTSYAAGLAELLRTLELGPVPEPVTSDIPLPAEKKDGLIKKESTQAKPPAKRKPEVQIPPDKKEDEQQTAFESPGGEKKSLAQFDAVNFSYDRKKDVDSITGLLFVHSHSLEYKSANHDFIIRNISEIEYKPATGDIGNNYMRVVYADGTEPKEIFFMRFTFWGDKPTLIMFTKMEELIGKKSFFLHKDLRSKAEDKLPSKSVSEISKVNKAGKKTDAVSGKLHRQKEEITGLAQFPDVNFSYDRKKDRDTGNGILYVNSQSLEYKSDQHHLYLEQVRNVQYKPAAAGIVNNYVMVEFMTPKGLQKIYFTRFSFWNDKPTLKMFTVMEDLIKQKKFLLSEDAGK